jgi:hypothetical protein
MEALYKAELHAVQGCTARKSSTQGLDFRREAKAWLWPNELQKSEDGLLQRLLVRNAGLVLMLKTSVRFPFTSQVLSVPLIIASLLLPLLPGVTLSGRSISEVLLFSSLHRTVVHTSFSWPVWIGMLAIILLTLLPLIFLALRYQVSSRPSPRPKAPIPWWGWLGLVLVAGSWVLAWSRFSWFSALQQHTFIPLWLGYILVLNALCFRRSRACLLRDHRAFFIALFPLSAVFWWYFEYLNSLVGNWRYINLDNLEPMEYLITDSLAFSTVLPAVLSTMGWLSTFPRLSRPFAKSAPWPYCHTMLTWVLMWILGVVGLGALALWPDYLYPLVWVAPVLVISAVRGVFGRYTLFSPLQDGDWRPVVLSALAALVCGFFWELWNFRSLAHWEYSIPWVDRFHLFEMPLLGYAGYLPFGLMCLSVANICPTSPLITHD